MILPDQRSYLFTPTGTGQWTNTTDPYYRGVVITQLSGEFNFQMRFKNGTLQRYDRIIGFANAAGLRSVLALGNGRLHDLAEAALQIQGHALDRT